MTNTKIITIEKNNNVGRTIIHELPEDAVEVNIDVSYNKRTRIVTATVEYELKYKPKHKSKP